MATDIENKVETAWVTTLEANAYIIANSIPVRGFHDNTKNADVGIEVVVRANPASNEFPSSALWLCNVELMAVTFIVDDLAQTNLDTLYKQVLGVAIDTPLSTLTTNGTITFNGKTQLDPNEQMYDEEGRFQTLITNIACHVQV